MSKPIVKFQQKRFIGGVADYLKESSLDTQFPNSSFVYARSINFRDDPQSVTLLPGAVKESGSVVTDLILWGETIPTLSKYFFYGNMGNIYLRSSAGTYTKLNTAPSSHGNGLAYFTGDDYLYYASDSWIGRYGPVSGSSPQFSNNFLLSQGGTPLNTNSLSVVAASSQYATAADSASLSVTGDLTLEAYFYANSLPSVGSSMTLLGKWDESGALRSYKMDISAISGYFGSGSDGALTISTNTTEAPIDSACTGTASTQTLSATNASFTQGQVILIHQSQGTNAGQWERNTISGYSAGTITLGTPLLGTYTTGAQVRVLKQYSSITVNSGVTWTAKAWNGSTGGILSNLCSGTITVTGNIVADSCGFRGGAGNSGGAKHGTQGEGTLGVGSSSSSANGNGGGTGNSGGTNGAPGGGGGNGSAGGNGILVNSSETAGTGGLSAGTADLTTMVLGGGGGGGTSNGGSDSGGNGAKGGGIIFLIGVTVTVAGVISSNGGSGSQGSGNTGAGGGAGSGGSILLKAQTATLGSAISAIGGTGGLDGSTGGNDHGGTGGSGGDGRITIDYLTSYTGTSNPTLNAIQDSSLVTTTTYQARLGISNDGTAFEYLTQNLSNLTTGNWNRLSIAWSAATSTASFYLNAVLLGTFTGTKTAISDNASLLYIAANKNASVVTNYFDGLLDDVRVWSNVQTASQILINNQIELQGSEAGLAAYYKFNGNLNDTTGNANNLTNHSTTFSSNVPFPDATTRLDIDQSASGGTLAYTLPSAIVEDTTDTLSFIPVNDPQKSIAFNINAKGTGDWTVTIHDQQNNVVATQTITNGNIPASGFVEFTFATPWRIVIGKTYHAHLTVSTGTSSVKVTTASNLSTANYFTYFAFLVTDTQWHPITPFLNFLAIGNERYIATWDGAFYSANAVALPPGYRVRCFGVWREYLAVGVWKGSNIYDYPFGKVYFWDGISPTFNFSISVGEGQVNAMFGIDSDLYLMTGYRGYLADYKGGYFYNTGNTRDIKLKRLPNNLIPDTDTQEIYPGAFTMWRSVLQVGLSGVSNSTTIEKGVYSYGTYNSQYPETLSYDYPISTGNRSSTVSIGCVYPIGNKLMIGWQDGIAYGADIIDFANPPAPNGELQLMVQDDGQTWKEKTQMAVRADYLPLRSGESVSTEYKIDRAASWSVSSLNSTVGSKYTEQVVSSTVGRGREYQVGVNLYASGSTSPTLIGLALLGQNNPEEEQF